VPDGDQVTRRLRVAVAVCTYRRPDQLKTLLDSLGCQVIPGDMRLELTFLVVDNSPDFEARATVLEWGSERGRTVVYAAFGAGNIASGRNEALRLMPPDADFVALVDDDEVAEPDWLARYVQAQQRTSADILTGPVLAAYPSGTAGWLQSDDFYSVCGPCESTPVDEAVTGNAFLRCSTVRDLGLRFDESLGASGGEDQLFFRTARQRGASIWFEPSAVVHETVADERLSMAYLVRREYRKGNTLGLLDRSRPGWPPGRPVRRLTSAVFWVVTGLLMACRGLGRRSRQDIAAGLLRGARAVGMLAGLRGRTYQHYSREQPRPGNRVLALVVPEDPGYQLAGHSRFLSGFVAHYASLGMRVVVVVTDDRLSFLARRHRGGTTYRARGLVDVCGIQVVVSPTLLLRWVAWAAFRSAPRGLQGVVDRVRTAARSGRAVDHNLGTPLQPARSAYVRAVLEQERPDVVLFSGPFSVPDPLELPASTRAVGLICHDVVSERAADLRRHGYRVSPAEFGAEAEAAAMGGMTVVVAIQWDDAEVFRTMAPPGTEVVVCPVAVDAVPPTDDAVADQVLFIGSGSLPNVVGLRWFLDACWPDVRSSRPDARLHVVGTVCARIGSVPAGVVLRGEVANLANEYARASVVVVPLLAGSEVKIVEAVCHGSAVVTTSVGAQGLSRLTPSPFVQADTAEDFGAAVVRVLADPSYRGLLEAAAVAVAPVFSPRRAFQELDRHLSARGVLPAPGG